MSLVAVFPALTLGRQELKKRAEDFFGGFLHSDSFTPSLLSSHAQQREDLQVELSIRQAGRGPL